MPRPATLKSLAARGRRPVQNGFALLWTQRVDMLTGKPGRERIEEPGGPDRNRVRPFPMPKPRPMRILIVEDDRISRLLLRRILETIGDVEVIEAEDGQSAWELLDGGLVPDLSFLDINMPRLGGLELLERIRKDKRLAFIKVCFCSAVRDRRSVIRAAAFQPDFYILKPYSKSLIQAQVERFRGEAAAGASLAPVAAVCSRLGIDRGTYVTMLDSLIEELDTLTTRIPTLLMQLDVKGALLALDEIMGAAQNLGAHRVFELADSLARCFRFQDPGAEDRSLSKEEASAQVRKLVTQSSDQLLQVIQGVHTELQTIRQLSAEIAAAPREAAAGDEPPASARAAEPQA